MCRDLLFWANILPKSMHLCLPARRKIPLDVAVFLRTQSSQLSWKQNLVQAPWTKYLWVPFWIDLQIPKQWSTVRFSSPHSCDKHLSQTGCGCLGGWCGPLCFSRLHDEQRLSVHCINCYRPLSQKDYTVGSATDLPPFNVLIIKNDGQIKIEQLNMAAQSRSSPWLSLFRGQVCGSRTEAKLDFNWPETVVLFLSLQAYYKINLLFLSHTVRALSE